MKILNLICLVFLVFFSACASTGKKVVIWETSDIPRTYEILGPVSVREEIAESREEMIGGLADFVAKDGRISDQIPEDMRAALEAKRVKYKEMIFDKLGLKAKEHGADAVINVKYRYLPAYVSFSKKAVVTAEGQMVEYK